LGEATLRAVAHPGTQHVSYLDVPAPPAMRRIGEPARCTFRLSRRPIWFSCHQQGSVWRWPDSRVTHLHRTNQKYDAKHS